jgi:SAM-dependent methyltransferase
VRVLVAIAHHGTKNRAFLERMFASFRDMEHDVDLVVLSEAPKDLGPDVEVRVGAPTRNPWSLPFAHRPLFADRRDDYDLFVYSEDDTLIEQRHLDAALELSDILPDDHLVGSMRYEVHPDGTRSYCSMHSHYRWEATSVRRFGGLTFAQFSNDHAAWYVLTKAQLGQAIASGGFLVAPHEGEYDMLVSAATDVFTRCGFTRVLCLERIDDLLVHHLPNVYLGTFGIDEVAFRSQVDALLSIGRGQTSVDEFLDPRVGARPETWIRYTFTHRPADPAGLVAPQPTRILSVGVASGEFEREFLDRGDLVTTVPVDPVLAATQRARGFDVRPPTLGPDTFVDEGPFDRVLLMDVLPYLVDPVGVLSGLRPALRPGGQLIATMPDYRRYRVRGMVLRRSGLDGPPPRALATHRSLRRSSASVLRGWLVAAGFRVLVVQHRSATRADPFGRRELMTPLTGNTVAATATLPT